MAKGDAVAIARVMRGTALPVFAFLAFAAGAQGGAFGDARAWAATLDAPGRDAWQMPDRVTAARERLPDARVADIGAGTGYFAARLARALPQGKVYAVDVEPARVAHLAQRARDQGLPNLVARQGTRADPGPAGGGGSGPDGQPAGAEREPRGLLRPAAPRWADRPDRGPAGRHPGAARALAGAGGTGGRRDAGPGATA